MAKTHGFEIKDRDGEVIHAGRSPSFKAFVEGLVSRGESLARADLRRRDLSGVDVPGVVLDEALLDGADLRGMVAKGGSFVAASMRGVVAQGMQAERAAFQGVDLGPDRDVLARHDDGRGAKGGCVPSRLDGARLTFSDFDGAVLDGASFKDANMGRTSLSRVSSRGTSFESATLYDADFSDGTFVNPNFADARMGSTTRLEPNRLPDRTSGTTCVGGRFDDAVMDATTPTFRRDRAWNHARRALAYAVSSLAVVTAMRHLHVEENPFGEVLKDGGTLVVATTAAMVLKEKVADGVHEFVARGVTALDVAARRGLHALGRRVLDANELGVAFVVGPGARAVLGALAATRRRGPLDGAVHHVPTPGHASPTTVLFASGRQLARALEAVCAGRTRHRINGDVVLVRKDVPGSDAPTLVRYRADGGTSLAWTGNGRVLGTAEYSRGGDLLGAVGEGPRELRIGPTMRAFQAAILASNRVTLDYDGDTHEVRAGRDGSVIVVSRATRRPDNPRDAALIQPDGVRRTFRNGTEVRPVPAGSDGPSDEAAGTNAMRC